VESISRPRGGRARFRFLAIAVRLSLLRLEAGDLSLSAAPERIVPESERPLDFVVVGTNAPNGTYFFLPELGPLKGMTGQQRRELEAELFGLDVELSHGALFRRLPPETHVYVALADAAKKGASSEAFFRRYLTAHCGWTAADVARRVRFFRVPVPLVYTRDAGKILGLDTAGRAVIGTGLADQPFYQDFVALLAEAFPSRFVLRRFERGVSSEGGDEALGRLPDGTLVYFVGHHRFLRFFGRDDPSEAYTLSDAEIREAREAFSRSVLGLRVVAVPEAALKDPSIAAPELFHLDMLASLHSRRGDGSDVFVPTLEPKPIDRTTRAEVPPELVAKAQREYDEVAKELAALGAHVVRIPFGDHPARGPANVTKFLDASGRPSVMLAKYPYHLPAGEPSTPQARVDKLLLDFRDEAAYLRSSARSGLLPRWREAIRMVWDGLERALSAPSPAFDAKRRVFEERGYHVVEVPLFAWGEGGLHCLVLH
jgi:hypothetical protein